MINILIPMAGEGSRFQSAGYQRPKPFIDVAGIPMILRVLTNLQYPDARFILVARSDHLKANSEIVSEIDHNFNVTWITVDKLTEGTACTVLFARELIDNNIPLLIANSDQIVVPGVIPMIQNALDLDYAGSILCFKHPQREPKWSYAKIDEHGLVMEVKEKEAISDIATVGIYYFKHGSLFVQSAIDMIVRNNRVNNEFYTCPVYNYMIEKGMPVGIEVIPEESMHGIGTPDDLNKYLSYLK